jgi:thiazole synthase
MATQMHSDGTISIIVNGDHRRVMAGMTIAGLANELGLAPEKVAVERNLEIVPRSTLARGAGWRTATIWRSCASWEAG